MSKHRKVRFGKLKHFFRLHDWERTGATGSPDAGIFTQQKCRICSKTRMNKFFDENPTAKIITDHGFGFSLEDRNEFDPMKVITGNKQEKE